MEGGSEYDPTTVYISHESLARHCSSLPEGVEIKRFLRKAHDTLTSNNALIRAGLSMSARHAHSALGNGRSFDDWKEDVMLAVPSMKRIPAFRRADGFYDPSIPLNELFEIATAEASFAGMVLACAILESGFFKQTQMEWGENALMLGRRLTPLPNDQGLILARHLFDFLEPQCEVDCWLHNILKQDWAEKGGLRARLPETEWAPPPMPGEHRWYFTPALAAEIIASTDQTTCGNAARYAYNYLVHGKTQRPDCYGRQSLQPAAED